MSLSPLYQPVATSLPYVNLVSIPTATFSSHIPNICYSDQGLIQAVFDIGIPILDTLIWAYPNFILINNKSSQ